MSPSFLRLRASTVVSLIVFASPQAVGQARSAIGAAVSQLSGATQVSVGTNHTCAVVGSELYCWGVNTYGQLGDGTRVNRLVPTKVLGLSAGATQVAAGDSHTCAVLSTGVVQCWGFNLKGQLGNGTTVDSATPVTVTGLSSATQVAAGMYFSCAVDGGKARCWGVNNGGQLGDGTTTDRLTPTAGAGIIATVTRIATGEGHTCAVAGANVVCWGVNYQWQAWPGGPASVTYPFPIAVATTASDVAAGVYHSCALLTTGAVQCWGSNGYGQIGNGAFQGYPYMGVTSTSGLSSGVTAINAGGRRTCAIVSGVAKCWGDNNTGAVGDGALVNRSVPTAVTNVSSDPIAIDTGEQTSCAIEADGRVLCWGAKNLGDGTGDAFQAAPATVYGLGGGALALGAGYNHFCAVTSAGAAVCWGANAYGQLGDGTTSNRAQPVAVQGLGANVAKIAGGSDHSCAIKTDGAMLCWGNNQYGQLGDTTQISRTMPVTVSGLSSGVTSMALGYYHTCAIMDTGEARCWGWNQSGQVGDGSSISSVTAPMSVTGHATGTLAIAAGGAHTCSATASGVRCWGYGGDGNLGNGAPTGQQRTPVDVAGISGGATAVLAGNGHSCALVNGGVQCWGKSYEGQLGNGTTVQSNIPVSVTGLTSGVAGLAQTGGSVDHSCAILQDGSARCWGRNKYAQIGDGTLLDKLTPVPVAGLVETVTNIVVGQSATCALTTSGAVKCWGSRVQGQVGDGTWGFSATPVYVGNPLPDNPIRTFIPALNSGN